MVNGDTVQSREARELFEPIICLRLVDICPRHRLREKVPHYFCCKRCHGTRELVASRFGAYTFSYQLICVIGVIGGLA